VKRVVEEKRDEKRSGNLSYRAGFRDACDEILRRLGLEE
jgi:hypothetical protein